ncbi:Baculoviral IAP repeat-containing protein 3 [Mizuhopecten yessoensis]|uniref:Baculoviral IAP repeat-containing protein 3 n=3 Tax=Mizuhopecten yessoensis TaxID=6573 RepID=A0A210QB25_MIZYE|nr:Baculoviral IAP repeat-containing protein 3 [Mizuhopecten yessoensis]
MVVIVEPALHGLGRYFQQMEQGQQITVLESMQYEWMRVRSFWSFPRNAGVSYLYLARIGFFYTGRVSETCCYSCGQIYREWREGDNPLEIHRRISPHCLHLNDGDARNMPIYADVINQWPAIPWEPLLEEAARPPVDEEPADLPEAEALDRDTATVDTRSQHPSQKTNIAVHKTHDPTSLGDDASSSIGQHRESSSTEIGREDLSQVLPRLASLDSTPHPIAEAVAHTASAAEDQTEAGPSLSSSSEGASGRETGGSDRAPPDMPAQNPQPRADPNVQEQQQQEPRGQDPPPNNNPPGQEWGRIIFPQNPPLNSAPSAAPRPDEEQVPRGVPRADPQGNYMPRYPNYAVQATRSDTFLHGWPAYLNQTPYEMSSAGFFYTGNGDYCRCFYCGGGLRNWEPGDDPWVEHARWFPRCLYVRQNKGDRFVRLVQQRQENNRQNDPRQEPVLQPPPANPQPPPVERNLLQGQASPRPNQQGQQPGEKTNTPTTTGQQSQSQQGATARQNIEHTESTVDEMSLSAVESLKANGISSSRIQEALQIWKKQQKKAYKMSDVTSAKLMQIVFDQEEEENRRLAETNQLASSLAQRGLVAVGGETSDGAGAHFSAITSGDSTSNDPEMTERLSLYTEAEERKKQLMCSVCGENEVTIAFLPCGHLVCCFQCAPAMIKCPNCSEAVKGNVKVFLM